MMIVILYCFINAFCTAFTETNINVPGLNDELYIIGGNNTSIQQHPYQVSISYDGTLKGSGAVIRKKWIITTASMLAGYRQLNKVRIRTKSDQYDSGGRTYKIDKVVYHPLFSFSTMDYDVALLRVEKKMSFDDNLKSIKLAKSTLAPNVSAVVSGWGSNSSDLYVFNQIQAITVQTVNQTTCQANYTNRRDLTDRMFCAISVAYGPCWEDNGDALIFQNTLYGLMSWNKGCFAQQYPSVYTNITAVRSWVISVIKGHKSSKYILKS